MLKIIILAGVMFLGTQAFASEPPKHRPTGTTAQATLGELPKEVIARIKKIESKKRPKPRTWSGEQAKALMAKPGFDRVRQMAVDKGARYHGQLADGMNLNKRDKAMFLSILASAHEARLDALIYTLQQGSDYPQQVGKLARAGRLSVVFKKADPKITNRKLRRLLGKERFIAYLEVRDQVSGTTRKGESK